METHWIEIVGYGGTAMTVASYSMRTIIPLRIAGIASSAFFIIYGFLIQSWPMLATEFMILPLNCVRLYQLLKLLRQVDAATGDEFDVMWLEPFAKKVKHKAGDVLFAEGDVADHLVIVHSGQFGLEGRDIRFAPGDMAGELGFLSPSNTRTATLVCLADGEVGRVSYLDLKQLYFQNPKFGFYFLKLIARRMFENEARMRAAINAAARTLEPIPAAHRPQGTPSSFMSSAAATPPARLAPTVEADGP